MDEKLIASKICQKGGRLYLVGGAVRDEIMGILSKDKDYCVTGLDIDDFVSLFPKANLFGKEFPVFQIDGNEFALARKERKISKGYKGFEIYSSKDLKIEDDLKRRDITINAIAKDVLTGEIIDPYNGIEDIKNKRIRHISNSFSEDPLRAYRVARFAAKFNFYIDEGTYKLMNKLKDELILLSPERVFVELKKALSTDKPSIFFEVLRKAKILDVHFKEINDLIDIPQPLKYHPEGDVFNHTMIVLDTVSSKTEDVTVRFAALVHDIGKALTPKEILPQHIGHDERGINLIIHLSKRLKLPKKWEQRGKETIKYHMKAGICTQMRPYKQAKFFNTINRTSIGLENLQIIVDADDMLNRPNLKFSKLAKEILNTINGRYLIERGIKIEEIGKDKFLTMLYEKQADLIKKLES